MINKINFLGKIHSVQSKKNEHFQAKPIENDCFIKNKSNDKKHHQFAKWAIETNFIQSGLKQSMTDENTLGQGFTNKVYKINGNNDFVIRLAKRYEGLKDIDISDYNIYDDEDEKLEGNYGQCVARVKSEDITKPTIEILKMQYGKANSNPPPSAIYDENGNLKPNCLPYGAKERKEHYAKSLETLANMSQESYNDLIKALLAANEANYKFDYYNSNNFLLDEKKQKINIIDLEKNNGIEKPDFGNILYCLCNIDYLSTYLSKIDGPEMSEEDCDKVFENTVKIINKFSKALIDNQQKFSMEEYEFVTKMLSSTPMSFFLRTFSTEEKCKKLKEMNLLE